MLYHLLLIPGYLGAHINQGLVIKNNIRRHPLFPGDYQPKPPELLKQPVACACKNICASLLSSWAVISTKIEDETEDNGKKQLNVGAAWSEEEEERLSRITIKSCFMGNSLLIFFVNNQFYRLYYSRRRAGCWNSFVSRLGTGRCFWLCPAVWIPLWWPLC
mgnify:CR=1 FL=1